MQAITSTRAGFLSIALCLTTAFGTAQTTTTPPPIGAPTCPTVPTSLSAFSIESSLALTNFLTTMTPNIPPNVLASITGGAQQIRERLIYNSPANTITATLFLVAPGAPLPTPIATDVTQTTLATYTVSIANIYQSCTPSPAIMFVGTISGSSGSGTVAAGPIGSLLGAPIAISVGYTNANPPVINNVVTLVAGVAVAYAPAASGTVTFPAAPVTPPTSTGTGPVIVLNPAYSSTSGLNQVTQNPIALDASATQGALTYSWSATPPVSFAPGTANAAVEQVNFPSPGTYTFTLTVTGTGGTSTLTFPINFVR